MTTEEKEARLRELFRQKDAVTTEIHALLGGAEASPAPAREKRKYRKREKSAAPEPRPSKKGGKPCCGSLGRKHKNGCGKARHLGGEGKLPPDEKTWKCVNCEAKKSAPEAPEECDACPGTVFVEVEAWQA